MIKGTRVLLGDDARLKRAVINSCASIAETYGCQEVMLPVIWEPDPWIERSGEEIMGQMWTFEGKGGKPVTLIPEGTAIIQDMWNSHWSKSMPKPFRVFYITECFRYERPQFGRYRQFTQFGVEILGPGDYEDECIEILTAMLQDFGYADATINTDVERGLSYYSRGGFEAVAPSLGTAQQIAGGGKYAEGCGFAIGIDRLMLL